MNLPKALAFVARRLRIRVAPYKTMPAKEVNPRDVVSCAPSSGHAILMAQRLLYFDETDFRGPGEWLHEVAHLHLTPPWRTTEDDDELAVMFAWELAAIVDLHKRRLVTKKDVLAAAEVQANYGCLDGPRSLQWADVRPDLRERALAFMRETCCQARVLTYFGEPTWIPDPTWSMVDGARWNHVSAMIDKEQPPEEKTR
jgi:hypothetical protein